MICKDEPFWQISLESPVTAKTCEPLVKYINTSGIYKQSHSQTFVLARLRRRLLWAKFSFVVIVVVNFIILSFQEPHIWFANFNQILHKTSLTGVKKFSDYSKGDNSKKAKICRRHFKVFFTTTGPISTKLGTTHPWVNGVQVCSKKAKLVFKER